MSTTQPNSTHIDPDDNETPNEALSKTQQFVKAVGKLIKTGGSSKPKLQEPDPFDGSDS